jgi:PiT family inorganic phosphate transporter
MLVAVLAGALLFDFFNGFNGSATIVATLISSRALSPRRALLLTALAELIGPFLFGVAVANTVGQDLIDPAVVTPGVLLAALAAATAWSLVTWAVGIPSSTSHALIGALLGSALIAGGLPAIRPEGLIKVAIALLFSPLAGLLGGLIVMRLTLWLASGATPRVNDLFRRLQIPASVGLAVSQGANDAQKTMGVMTLALVAAGQLPAFVVPDWVVAASAGVMALGTAIGGWRLIRTLGGRIYKIRPIHGFTAQSASGLVILAAGLLGGPVSTTQVVSSAIMGAGAAERLSKVRWGVAREMLVAWGLTVPVTAALAALVSYSIQRLA